MRVLTCLASSSTRKACREQQQEQLQISAKIFSETETFNSSVELARTFVIGGFLVERNLRIAFSNNDNTEKVRVSQVDQCASV